MIAGVYNIVCEQGASFQRVFTLTNPDGTMYDLSEFSARMHVRKDYDATTPLIALTTSNGRIAVYGEFGEIHINLTAEDTATLTRNGVYDLEIFKEDGTVHRVVKGAFRVDREATK